MAVHYLLCFKPKISLQLEVKIYGNIFVILELVTGYTMLSPVWWRGVLTITCTTYFRMGVTK